MIHNLRRDLLEMLTKHETEEFFPCSHMDHTISIGLAPCCPVPTVWVLTGIVDDTVQRDLAPFLRITDQFLKLPFF